MEPASLGASTAIYQGVEMSRVQLALNVSDLDASVAFYTELFKTAPHKLRPGYANFAIAEPPLKLVLIEVPAEERAHGTVGALNHLGVEVESSQDVADSANRLRAAGLAAFDETDTTCCFAVQDKVWLQDPAGAPWEVYAITDDDPAGELAAPTGSVLDMIQPASTGTPGRSAAAVPGATC